MQHPCTLGIVVGIEELHIVRFGEVEDGPVYDAGPQVSLFGSFHAPAELVLVADQFVEQRRKVGCEALRQPQVVPVVLRDGITKPLVGGLVGYQSFTHRAVRVATRGVEDGARVLHPAKACAGLDVCELVVREGADVLGERVHDRVHA